MTENVCINPSEIAQGALLSYLHGDASPQIVEHIKRCSFCSAQVEQLRMVDARLLAVFYRDACPAPEVLADFALGRLLPTEKLRVAAHARACVACTEEVTSVKNLMDEGPRSLLNRLRESLALAWAAQPVAQTAAPARGEGWQGRFEAEELTITLSAHADRLTGRVREREAPRGVDYRGEAWLLSPDMETVEQALHSAIDARGRFQFTGLAAGSFALLLQIGAQDVALETIRIE